MKLYFTHGDHKQLIGEPKNVEELGSLIVSHAKKRFVALNGKLAFTFAAGAEMYVNKDNTDSGKYSLED